MKSFILFLTVFSTAIVFGCKSDDEMSKSDILDLGFVEEDANRGLSHKPTGIVDVQSDGQTVKINFGLDDFIKQEINADLEYYYYNGKSIKGDLFKAFPTVGRLADYYKSSQFAFAHGYSSYRLAPHMDGNVVYSKIEYALAQECFKDECHSMTRKSVLQMVVNKHEAKDFLLTYTPQRTGLFLMAVILIKEKDAAFLDAVRENPDLQNVLSLDLDMQVQIDMFSSRPNEQRNEINDFTYQSAVNFLFHQ